MAILSTSLPLLSCVVYTSQAYLSAVSWCCIFPQLFLNLSSWSLKIKSKDQLLVDSWRVSRVSLHFYQPSTGTSSSPWKTWQQAADLAVGARSLLRIFIFNYKHNIDRANWKSGEERLLISKLAPSDVLPPANLSHLNVTKQCHHLGI